MKKIAYLFISLNAMIIAGSCKSDDSPPPPPPLDSPSGIGIVDNGNQGDGRDIYIAFQNLENEDNLRNYNLVLSKTGTNLTYDMAISLEQDRMYTISKTGNPIKHQVQSSFKDSDGDAIKNDQPYNAYILTVSSLEDQSGSLSFRSEIELKDAPYFEVKTLGTYPDLEALSYHDGTIIAVALSNRLLKIDSRTGDYSVFDTNSGGPLGGGFDPQDGSYYGAMYRGGDVLKYDIEGNSTVFASGFNGPIGIAVDDEGYVYVTNFDGNTISKVSPEGNKSTFVNNSTRVINGPDGIVIAKGTLYSINFYDGRIFKISSTGEPSPLTTLPGRGNGYIAYTEDYFYAPSYTERKVYKIGLNGGYEHLAGSGLPSSVDGPALLASFENPNGIAVAGDTVFVGDNSRLRIIIKHE